MLSEEDTPVDRGASEIAQGGRARTHARMYVLVESNLFAWSSCGGVEDWEEPAEEYARDGLFVPSLEDRVPVGRVGRAECGGYGAHRGRRG